MLQRFSLTVKVSERSQTRVYKHLCLFPGQPILDRGQARRQGASDTMPCNRERLPCLAADRFDREEILERLKAERNFALIGQRKVGKTSIILEYLNLDTPTLRKRGILGAGAPSHFGRCLRHYAVPAGSRRAYDTLQSEGF